MTYDELYEIVGGLPQPEKGDQLEVEWLLPDVFGVGCDIDGRYVIVMVGAPVHSSSEIVHRSLVYGTWLSSHGKVVTGTVLQVPAGEEFRIATTTIGVEFIRRGIETRPLPEVFDEVEDFIELILRRVLLPPDSILGLVGELLVFDRIIDVLGELPRHSIDSPCSAWRGWTTQSRDFRFRRIAIEVKTTRGIESRHHINSLDQIEPRTLDGGLTERLYLLSIGLVEATGGLGWSIAGLVDQIIAKLDDDEKSRFIDQLAQYGPADCAGYQHDSMSAWKPYAQGYQLTFEPRLYDLADPLIRVIRSADLQNTFVIAEGISYLANFPEVVPGSHGKNPQTNLPKSLRTLFASE